MISSYEWDPREARSNHAVDKRRCVVGVNEIDVMFTKDARQFDAAKVFGELALLLAHDHRDAFGLHDVGKRSSPTDAADRESVPRRVHASTEFHDHPLETADDHPEGHLHDVLPAI